MTKPSWTDVVSMLSPVLVRAHSRARSWPTAEAENQSAIASTWTAAMAHS